MGSPAQASCPSRVKEAPQTPSGTGPKYRPLTWQRASALHPSLLLQGWQARLPATLRRPRHTQVSLWSCACRVCVCLECACVM